MQTSYKARLKTLILNQNFRIFKILESKGNYLMTILKDENFLHNLNVILWFFSFSYIYTPKGL